MTEHHSWPSHLTLSMIESMYSFFSAADRHGAVTHGRGAIPVTGNKIGEALTLGIRVVEAHVAAAAVHLGLSEVEAHGLGVADVQVAVRLRRKARHPLAARRRQVLRERLLGVDPEPGMKAALS